MSLTRPTPELKRQVEEVDELIGFFRSGEKPQDEWRVGVEHEKVAVYAADLAPVPYEGERGIRALLETLLREHGFEPLMDGEQLVGLERAGASITLEPGGQLELSGAPRPTLHDTCREVDEHLSLLKHVSDRFGIVWLGLGMNPLHTLAELPRVPRQRYEIMRSVLGGRDRFGLHMMHATGAVQASVDFASEGDMARKLRLALAASPIVSALFANSPIAGGKATGFESARSWAWRHTDSARCGLLPFVFDDDFGDGTAYARYTEWALDVPMFFIVRDEHHIPTPGLSFRRYLEHGFCDERSTLDDWHIHLTTLFPEARLKRVIELRGADAVPQQLVCALPALWKGLLYDAVALDAALARLAHWSYRDVDRLHLDVSRHGLQAMGADGPLLDVARELVDISAGGLRRGAERGAKTDEVRLLDPLYEIADRGTSPARLLLKNWEGVWHRRPGLLVEYASY